MTEGKKFDELRDFLAEKFSIEKKRLKTYGTKADSFDLANAVARHVQVIAMKNTKQELKALLKNGPNTSWNGSTRRYIQDRLNGYRKMIAAIQHAAEEADKRRPYNPKKKAEKHDKRRSSKSSRHH